MKIYKCIVTAWPSNKLYCNVMSPPLISRNCIFGECKINLCLGLRVGCGHKDSKCITDRGGEPDSSYSWFVDYNCIQQLDSYITAERERERERERGELRWRACLSKLLGCLSASGVCVCVCVCVW